MTVLGLPLNVHNAAGQSTLFEQPSRSNRYKLNDQTWDLIKDSVGAIDDKLTFTVDEGKPVSYTRREVHALHFRAFLQNTAAGQDFRLQPLACAAGSSKNQE